MTTNPTTTETVHDILQQISADEWTVQVVADTIEISLTERRLCAGCGQPITVSGPAVWLDRDGDAQGSHSHQHGCGTWNIPHYAVRFHAVDVADGDLDELVKEMVGQVAVELDERLEAERAAIRDLLRKELAEAIETGEATGSETTPGAWLNGEQWEAWAYDPALDSAREGEVVVVTAEDLAEAVK